MAFSSLPSVDRLLRTARARRLAGVHGRATVTDAIRQVLADARRAAGGSGAIPDLSDEAWLDRVSDQVAMAARRTMRPVFNLTGTVLHTNLGRAPLPPAALAAIEAAARQPVSLEFDLDAGGRGDRDAHVEARLCRLTGAEAATVVNNNAAAVLLALNTLALRKEVPTSRGELIEIGGSFRMPDIMARAGCRLREVGTTNRVHLRDYADAIGSKTAAVMKVHTSNYRIVGFTSSVPERELAALCRQRGVPLVVDLGSGTLADLRRFGLPHEPTPAEVIADGADLVTFSGDKLLGGPQAGIIVGRKALVEAVKRNPLKRALRVDKLTLAALDAVLDIYADPERLPEQLPAIRLLTRTPAEIRAAAERVRPAVAGALADVASVAVVDCRSEVGSGALPTEELPSAGLAIVPLVPAQPRMRRSDGAMLERIARAFRALPVPVLGRITEGSFVLDLRCLDDEEGFVRQLEGLRTLLETTT